MRTRQAPYGEPTADWAVGHAPAANVQATATRAAAGLKLQNICTGFVMTYVAGSSAPTANTITFSVLDGASGSSTVLWGPITLGIAAVAGAMNGITRTGLWLQGSANTPMTAEFSGAGGANTKLSLVLEGTTQPVTT
jgi:hypothetical protein